MKTTCWRPWGCCHLGRSDRIRPVQKRDLVSNYNIVILSGRGRTQSIAPGEATISENGTVRLYGSIWTGTNCSGEMSGFGDISRDSTDGIDAGTC